MAQATAQNTVITNLTDSCIYKDAHEKFVKTHVAYTRNNGSDYTLYKDREFTIGLTAMELYNMFIDGMVIVRSDGMLKPFGVTMTDNNEMCTVCCVNNSGTFSILEYTSYQPG